MPRYFLEICYRGTIFNGFQIQNNSKTIQGEIEKGLSIIFKQIISTTTASRTDTGVHAHQNYLHFDIDKEVTQKNLYNLNAILDRDIVVRNIHQTNDDAHSRFDATSREYTYYIIHERNPFLNDTSYYFPFQISIGRLNEAAKILIENKDFSSFAKRHSDVNNFNCKLMKAFWTMNEKNQLVFKVTSNRFLRGMVRALVATQLLVGRGKVTMQDFIQIIDAKDCTKADFSAPANGLFLVKVNYPANQFIHSIPHINNSFAE